MKYLLLLSLLLLTLSVTIPVRAQSVYPHVFYCVGDNPKPPCATIGPSRVQNAATTPTIYIYSVSPVTSGSPSPSSTVTSLAPSQSISPSQNPSPSSTPCQTSQQSVKQNSVKEEASSQQGILQQLLQLFKQLFQQLGIPFPGSGNSSSPCPQPSGTPSGTPSGSSSTSGAPSNGVSASPSVSSSPSASPSAAPSQKKKTKKTTKKKTTKKSPKKHTKPPGGGVSGTLCKVTNSCPPPAYTPQQLCTKISGGKKKCTTNINTAVSWCKQHTATCAAGLAACKNNSACKSACTGNSACKTYMQSTCPYTVNKKCSLCPAGKQPNAFAGGYRCVTPPKSKKCPIQGEVMDSTGHCHPYGYILCSGKWIAAKSCPAKPKCPVGESPNSSGGCGCPVGEYYKSTCKACVSNKVSHQAQC